ncbi:zinc-binding alcohol dehydrogenase family protein [Methylophaga sp. OBS4]|uniref:zinc-binding alcohol dehydrogenase family protein n=1 Tax=Methylophaga sp. OBS4 TaxID=2991935 RepID=UPI00225580F0|nr:zinc-binding alcohol dehydrogenase family protein [Methylophaga sp. OBS4]MCX4186685.1 zinc-binding alcohol dehydrogenase family protein [Methylophaga sp. OBS4]
MKAYGYTSADAAPELIEQPNPVPTGRDLLIEIEAIAVNPVDTKVKAGIKKRLDTPKVIGWDACGTVIAAGGDCELFKIGDKVFYAGDISRPGCYASHQLVDERIVGFAPHTLTATEAAAMPLTSITAWEALFSRMKIHPNVDINKTLLIVGAAGGVGSIAIQLAKKVVDLNVVATASRSESADWCLELGADHIINHHNLAAEYQQLGIAKPDYILCLGDTDSYFDTLAELVAPQGMICFVVTSQQNHNIDVLKTKSAGLVWEFMFTRPMFKTADITAQHQLLNRIAEMLDEGLLRCTLRQTFGAINADTIHQAHQQLLSGTTLGKIALTAIKN